MHQVKHLKRQLCCQQATGGALLRLSVEWDRARHPTRRLIYSH